MRRSGLRDRTDGYADRMEPTEASTSTTGPAPMNSLPDGPHAKAEAGEHGIPVDADPDEVDADEAGSPAAGGSDQTEAADRSE